MHEKDLLATTNSSLEYAVRCGRVVRAYEQWYHVISVEKDALEYKTKWYCEMHVRLHRSN